MNLRTGQIGIHFGLGANSMDDHTEDRFGEDGDCRILDFGGR